ncbi:MAG: glycerophosphodiester phosphodiesterase family protein [Devosia sp.]|nr:glycerophosphodiester phosphodiesterase family protein [Devosia sp.]
MRADTGDQPTVSPGLALVHDGHVTRLKWHRLRRRMSDPLFGAEVMAEGFAQGASMELDLRVRRDGGFVVLHDDVLEGETTGTGRIADLSHNELRAVHFKDGRPLIFTEDLASMLQRADPEALLQFDMKDDLAAIGSEGLAHLAALFSQTPTPVIVSGASLEFIVEIGRQIPNLLRGIDPTDKLADLYRGQGLKAVEAELVADLRGPTQPRTVYLAWQLVLGAATEGLDLIGLCHAEGKLVDAWTFTLEDPERGFTDEEWLDFSALLALKPDQITTDEAPATERAYLLRADA